MYAPGRHTGETDTSVCPFKWSLTQIVYIGYQIQQYILLGNIK